MNQVEIRSDLEHRLDGLRAYIQHKREEKKKLHQVLAKAKANTKPVETAHKNLVKVDEKPATFIRKSDKTLPETMAGTVRIVDVNGTIKPEDLNINAKGADGKAVVKAVGNRR
jgi:hypothetical protein